MKTNSTRLLGVLVAASLMSATAARAEMTQVRVATQIGLSYLPLLIMEHEKLWEKKAEAKGLPLTVEYSRLGGGSPLNDALLSDSVQIASAGVAPLLTLWDRTKSNYKVKALSAINASPMYILTNNPNIKSIKDFTDADRIAVASVKISINAIVFDIGAEKALGPGKGNALDNIQVAMAHPEAYAALTSHAGGITGYVASSPFQERALTQPGIYKVTDSFEILGGPATLSLIYAKSDFVEKNPKLVEAFMEAQKEAVEMIKKDRAKAIDDYYAVTNDKTDRALVEQILSSKNVDFDIYPKATMPIADFMFRTGVLKTMPASWKDYFFDTMKDQSGS
ncbi:MAG: ABC transporter substrate-binding protein [Bradyrhizobiaceae bacterium]|nr:MAG: ABC transporter substrate-binding protein [Bradyrhizobiaceae bacterium]